MQKTIYINSFADFAKITAGDATHIELEGYDLYTGKGGGLFALVESNLPAIDGYRASTADKKVFQRVYANGIEPSLKAEDLGWTPAFQGDCSEFINKLFSAAAAAGVAAELPRTSILRCSKWIKIPAKLKKIIGNNSFIWFYYTDTKSVGIISEKGVSVSVTEMHIDYDRNDTRLDQVIGLWLIDQKNCTFTDCSINSKNNHSLLARTSSNATVPSIGLILKNVITYSFRAADNDPRQNFLFDIDGSVPATENWLANFKSVDKKGHKDYVMSGCESWNGRYGIGGNWSEGFVVTNHYCYGNTRAISFQNDCNFNKFSNITMYQTKSAPLHFGYNTEGNEVKDAYIHTGRGDGQGLIHVNLGGLKNKFSNVVAKNAHSYGQRWGIYCGGNCSDNVFENISLEGNFHGSVVCVEADWVVNSIDKHGGYGYTITPNTDGTLPDYANVDSVGNTFRNISISTNSKAPGIVLHAGKHNLVGTVLSDITVNAPNLTKDYWVVETSTGKVDDAVFENVGVDLNKSTFGDLRSYALYREPK